MFAPTRLFSIVLTVLLLSGCSAHYRVEGGSDSPSNGPEARPDEKGPTEKGPATKPASKLNIPPGHLPDPGQCRIWIPGTPPGHQPPAGECTELAQQVPPGAWLISRASKKSKEFDVVVYEDARPGVVLEIRIYSTKDGSFLGLR
jgi:hypothetical protein